MSIKNKGDMIEINWGEDFHLGGEAPAKRWPMSWVCQGLEGSRPWGDMMENEALRVDRFVEQEHTGWILCQILLGNSIFLLLDLIFF